MTPGGWAPGPDPERRDDNSFARDAIAGLVARSHDDAIGRELRRMAYRADLPV